MKRYFPLIIAFFFIASCSSYNKIKLTPTGFYKNKDVPKNIKNYRVFVHDGDGKVYTADSPTINGDTLSATFIKTESTSSTDQLVEDNKKEGRDEIHMYTSKTLNDEELTNTHIASDQLTEVEMYAKEEDRVFRLIGIIIGMVVIGVLLILGIFVLVAKSAEETEGSSDGSDSGGGSGSNSDSGNSSGSDTASGCYVATMVYGSYDADEVMVLRKFRDQFLQKYVWGRKFISWYYAKSPGFVERNKHNKQIHKPIKWLLNLFVLSLRLMKKW